MTRTFATVLAFITLAAATATAQFKAGFAERDITPAIGSEQPGGYGKAYHRTLHDPCKVRATVFDDGKSQVALVGLDALFIHRETTLNVRKAIAKNTGIPGEAILLGASHSHSSGPMSGVMPGEYDHARDFVKKLAYEQSTAADPEYLKKVEAAIIDAVTSAYRDRVEVTAGVGKGIENQVAFNRRFSMRTGFAMTHPGLGNPDIIEPAGPTDPEVGVIGAWNKDRKLIGCVVNFCCHATTNPGGISANYVYYLEKVIQSYYGKDVVVVFLNGMSGDVTQVDNRSTVQHRAAEKWAEFVGARVGAEALKVLLTMDAGTFGPVSHRTKTLTMHHRIPDPERVKRCLEIVQKDKTKVDATEWTFAKEIVMLDAKLAKEKTTELEVQAIQVGPAVFVSSPAEYFCQYGLDIKKNSGFAFTFPVSLANGCVGYVPTEDAFGPRGGGYETRLTSYSNLEITAGTKIRDAGIALAKQLAPGEVPSRPKPAPFKNNPWSYGSVPPEIK